MFRPNRARRLRSATVLMVSLGIVLAACGGDAEPDAAAVPAASAAPTASAALPATEAPDAGAATTAPVAPATEVTTAATGAATGAATTVPAPVEAPEALRFSAPLVGGGTIDAASLAGPPVLFWFWAPY